MPTAYQRFFPVLLSVTVGLGLLSSAWAITPPAYDQYQRGVSLEQAKDFRGAEQAYRTAIGLDPYDSLTYQRLASLVERDGRRDEALQLYEQALKLNPKDTMIHLSMAQLLEAKNQPEKALDQYHALLSANPDYGYALLPMARLERSQKHLTEAKELYERFLKAYPNHFDARRELAGLQLGDKDYSQAAANYKTLKAQDETRFKDDLAYGISLNNADHSDEALKVFERITTPSAVLYEQMALSYEKLNRLDKAAEYYQRAITLAPEQKYENYLKIADLSLTMKQPQQAIAALRSYLKHNPNNTRISKSLADLYAQNKDYASAEPLYETALKGLPETDKAARLDTLRNLGFSEQMQGQLPEAIDTYEKSLALEDDHQTRLNLALAYHQHGDYKMALDMYRRLLTEDPASTSLRKDMGHVLLALGEQTYNAQDYEGASKYYQDALLLGDVSEPTALMGLGNAQFALKNYPLAYTTYQRILEKDPENVSARINKSQLDMAQKNYPVALEGLGQVTEKHPDNLEAWRLLAQTQEAMGNYSQAVTSYKKALTLKPNEASLLIGYGNALRQVGDVDQAMQAYEMARQADPHNEMIHYNLGSVYNMKNQLDASITEYRAALALNPQFIDSYYGMGTTYEKQQRWADALKVYQAYIDKAPASSAYVPQAKARMELIRKSLIKPVAKPAATKSAKP